MIRPFHLALPVPSLDPIVPFYCDLLGCKKGRTDETWIDLDFFGHQLVFHRVPGFEVVSAFNPVDQHRVPIPHFGVVLTPKDWQALADKLKHVHTEFIIDPYTRFKGKPGEQSTFFFKDPVGYKLEFKAFADDAMLFYSAVDEEGLGSNS